MSVCLHEKIRCTNCEKFCLLCGVKLPADFTPGKVSPTAEEAAEKAAEAVEKPTKRVTRKKVK